MAAYPPAAGPWPCSLISAGCGYSRYKYAVLYLAVIVLVLLVQVFQSIGTRLAARLDRRIKE